MKKMKNNNLLKMFNKRQENTNIACIALSISIYYETKILSLRK